MKAIVSPLKTLSTSPNRWINQFELMLYTQIPEENLLPHLDFLEEHGLIDSKPDVENGSVYKATLAGMLHATGVEMETQRRISSLHATGVEMETQRRISSFPPSRISYPPVAA